MNNAQHLIGETFALLQEPVHISIKYDGELFKVEVLLDSESYVTSCGLPQYFDLEKAIGSCLLHYMKLKTESKHRV